MKRYIYYNHWQKDSLVQEQHPTYPKEYELEWRHRSKADHNAKIIAAVATQYGTQIFEKSLSSLSTILRLRPSLKLLPELFDIVDANLTVRAKAILQPTIEGGRIIELDSTPIEMESTMDSTMQKKWLTDTDIDTYLRYFYSCLLKWYL